MYSYLLQAVTVYFSSIASSSKFAFQMPTEYLFSFVGTGNVQLQISIKSNHLSSIDSGNKKNCQKLLAMGNLYWC